MEDIISTINAIEKSIIEGKRPMLGTGKTVDDASILGMINYLRNILPEEINMSKIVLKNKEDILRSANEEAQAMLQNATIKVNQCLDEHKLRIQAEIEAKEIKDAAEAYANDIYKEVNNEIFNIISNVEANLNDMLDRLSKAKHSILNIKKD